MGTSQRLTVSDPARRLLVDYGEVLSAPLAEEAIADLAALAGQPRAAFLDRYWGFRRPTISASRRWSTGRPSLTAT